MRSDSCCCLVGGSGCGKKWLDSGYISKVEATCLHVRLHVCHVGRRRVKGDSKLLCLSNWKMEFSVIEMWQTVDGRLLGRERSEGQVRIMLALLYLRDTQKEIPA